MDHLPVTQDGFGFGAADSQKTACSDIAVTLHFTMAPSIKYCNAFRCLDCAQSAQPSCPVFSCSKKALDRLDQEAVTRAGD